MHPFDAAVRKQWQLHQIPNWIAIKGLSEGLEILEEVHRSEPHAAVKGSTEIKGENLSIRFIYFN